MNKQILSEWQTSSSIMRRIAARAADENLTFTTPQLLDAHSKFPEEYAQVSIKSLESVVSTWRKDKTLERIPGQKGSNGKALYRMLSLECRDNAASLVTKKQHKESVEVDLLDAGFTPEEAAEVCIKVQTVDMDVSEEADLHFKSVKSIDLRNRIIYLNPSYTGEQFMYELYKSK